jgi:hypothetical protein
MSPSVDDIACGDARVYPGTRLPSPNARLRESTQFTRETSPPEGKRGRYHTITPNNPNNAECKAISTGRKVTNLLV